MPIYTSTIGKYSLGASIVRVGLFRHIPLVTYSSGLTSKRFVGADLTSPLAKLGHSRELAADIKEGRQRNNKEIIAAFQKIQTYEEIHYRKTDRPWDLVPKYAKRRVSDLCGILKSEDRMEIEQAIDKMQSLCKVDLFVVIVPTVGYVTPKVFANSIFFNWEIGEPSGNGLLLVIAQREATVQLVAGLPIEEYFDSHFLDPAVKEIFQPLVREGNPSYATVQLVYAIARQAQEMHALWENGLLSIETRNKTRFVGKTVRYGVFEVPYLVFGALFFAIGSVIFISQIIDTICPKCNGLMNRIRDEKQLEKIMSRGQYLEHKNGCAFYRVWKCPYCEDSARTILYSRDLHQSNKCLQCTDCQFYTCTLEKEIEKLPTKHEDGLKKINYHCENCFISRELTLPLYRPLDSKPDEKWYQFLVDGSQSHKTKKIDLKL